MTRNTDVQVETLNGDYLLRPLTRKGERMSAVFDDTDSRLTYTLQANDKGAVVALIVRPANYPTCLQALVAGGYSVKGKFNG